MRHVYPENSTANTASGPIVKQLVEILDSLNVSYTVEPEQTNTYGLRNETGHWSGFMGSLQRHEADVGLQAVMNIDRYETTIFSTFTARINAGMVGGVLTTPPSTSILRLALVFDMEVWISLFISMVALILVSSFRVNRDDHQVGAVLTPLPRGDIFMLVSCYLSALFLEGTPRSPPTTRGCSLYAIWWLAMLVLANGFCGIMRATMMAPAKEERVRDVQHLSTLLHRIQPIVVEQTFLEAYFRTGRTKEQQSIWRAIRRGSRAKMSDIEKGVHLPLVAEGREVICGPEDFLKFTAGSTCNARNITNLYFVSEPIMTAYSGMMWNRNVDRNLIQAVDKRMAFYRESYIINKWVENEMLSTEKCFFSKTEGSQGRSLGMEDVGGLFLLHLVCLSFAFLVLLTEKTVPLVTKLYSLS